MTMSGRKPKRSRGDGAMENDDEYWEARGGRPAPDMDTDNAMWGLVAGGVVLAFTVMFVFWPR